jgi:hypothetical protein
MSSKKGGRVDRKGVPEAQQSQPEGEPSNGSASYVPVSYPPTTDDTIPQTRDPGEARSYIPETTGGHGAPPAYSEVSIPIVSRPAPNQHRQRLAATPGLPTADILSYRPAEATLSSDESIVTIQDELLASNKDALAAFISAQAALPPRAQIRITGYQDGFSGPDFDIRINMMSYFLQPGSASWNFVKLVEPREMAFRGSTTKTIDPHVDGGLAEWTKKFCKSQTTAKAYALPSFQHMLQC